MNKLGMLAISIAAAMSSTVALAGSITVEQIVQLSELKMGDDAIIAKIRGDRATFDLSPDQMLALKQRGVSSGVIAAMIENKRVDSPADMSLDSPDPAVPHPPGLYLLAGTGDQAKMVRLDPQSANQMKTGGIWGYALTGGLASASVKVAIPNETAHVQANVTPYFFFFFDDSRRGQPTNTFLGSTVGASSPAEFTLVRLMEKKGRREARVGSMNIGGAKTGVMDEDRIDIDYKMVRSGVYKVIAKHPLAPGEYGFLYSFAGAGLGGAASSRIFDFSVR